MRVLLKKSAERLLDFIYPQNLYCVICGNFIDSTRTYSLCDHCIRHIEWGNIEIADSPCLASVRGCFRYGLYGWRLIFEL